MRAAKLLAPFLLGVASFATAGCPSGEGARAPRPGDPTALAKSVTKALEIEQTRPANEALDAWIAVLAEAREITGTPLAREAALAAIDALVGHEVFGLESLGSDIGLAQRAVEGRQKVEAALDAALDAPAARDPMVRVYLADARERLASAKGDAGAVLAARRASGCATEATVIGPFPGGVLAPLEDPGPVDGGAFSASYPPSAPLALAPKAVKSAGRGCLLDITGSAKASGLRYVVMDVDVPSAQRITVGIDSILPAKVFVGGKVVTTVPYGEVVRRATRMGSVEVGAPGKVRVVAKLGAYSNEPIVLVALGENGAPLATSAPAPSSAPTTSVGNVGKIAPSALPQTVEGRVTWALGLIAAGDVRLAEGAVADVARPTGAAAGSKPSPAAALVYARTLRWARDIPTHRRLERQRAAIEAALAGWPTSWEAIVAHAQIVALQRRGGAGEVEAIADARTRRDAGKDVDPMVDAYLALVGDQIYGVREDSLARVKPRLAKTWIGWKLERATAKETTDVAARADCDAARPDLGKFDCASARYQLGDHKGVLAEIARLRTVLDQPKLAAEWEIASTIKTAGIPAAKALYDAADPGDRSLRTAQALAPSGAGGLEWLRRELRVLDGDPRTLLDAINVRRAAGDASVGAPPAVAYESKAKTVIEEDRKKPARPDAGTVILAREERYDMSADGFVHGVLWDVRRLSGTQDVEANASAGVAMTSGGIGWMGRTVQRIHKADGTIVEPDRIAAAQAGAELSQIEPGDYVELVSEGWFLARADGTFDLDTADLLPSRTAVESATVSLALPASLNVELWSHPELGAPTVGNQGAPTAMNEGGKKTLTFKLANHDVRRAEKGQAGIDREVAVRLSTWTWARLGREARESTLADDERLPEVSAWVAQAVGADKAPTLDLLVRLSKASKKAIPRVGLLPLGLGGISTVQTYNARTVLLDAQGSRVELVHRALDEVGVKNEIVWAESGPYSADPKMVARPWRFSSPPHALLVAWVAPKPGEAAAPYWVDLDVDGTPPPPGRTSPELRGRFAIDTAGKILPVPPNAAEEPDLATIDLSVDESGKAKGTLALLLRGRDAQDVSAVLEELAGEERDETLRSYVLAWMPQADVLEVKASAETWQVTLSAKIEVPALLVPDGTRFAIPGTSPLHGGGRATTLGATYASQAKRTTALTIRDAILYDIHRVIRLPKGTSISTPLPAVDAKDPGTNMVAKRKVKVDGTTLIEDFSFSLPTGVVAPKAFEAFTDVARAIDDGFLTVVRVQPPGGAAKVPAAKPVEKPGKPVPKPTKPAGATSAAPPKAPAPAPPKKP